MQTCVRVLIVLRAEFIVINISISAPSPNLNAFNNVDDYTSIPLAPAFPVAPVAPIIPLSPLSPGFPGSPLAPVSPGKP